ncbi:FAD-dependent oxidoreductase [Candidatus Woesebacteria bacterium]|nr:MAG: FAD-dependent oxidoreductase [Candidatus Woesebacteria bacterium]
MKIGIIGAGYVGLTAGLTLAKKGHGVTIYESSSKPGGLASGFRAGKWEWAIEEHYHHWFTSDTYIKKLAKEIHHPIIFSRPKTSVIIKDELFQLDSPLSLLQFSQLSVTDRIRTGMVLAYLKTTPFWKKMESQTAHNYLERYMGRKSWQLIWQPLMEGKFGDFSKEIPASWFWARIKKRSSALGYPEEGFQAFAQSIADEFQKEGGKIIYNEETIGIEKTKKGILITNKGRTPNEYDFVICTLPTSMFIKLTSGLPQGYINSLKPLKGLGAITLLLSLKHEFLKDNTYWLNVNDTSFPFLAVVEHTHLIDKKHYNDENLVYIGNYLPVNHKYFSYTQEALVNEFTTSLKRINRSFNKSWINDSYVFKASFAQPIIPLNYSKQIPPFETPIEGLYLANIQQVYPWDRGTNYAVELGEKVANIINKL